MEDAKAGCARLSKCNVTCGGGYFTRIVVNESGSAACKVSHPIGERGEATHKTSTLKHGGRFPN